MNPAPRDEHITISGRRFHYLDWGEVDAPAVLLLHGFNQTAHSWDEFAQRLATDGFRAVALDQRGHGDSDAARDGDYSREAMAEDAYELFTALSIRSPAVVAMSMGAVHAAYLAHRHPRETRCLVIVDYGPDADTRGVELIRATMQLRWPSFDEAVAAMHRFNPRRSLDNLRARLAHSLGPKPDGSWSWKVDAAGFAAHPRFRESPAAMWNILESIECPTLVVRGADSDILSEEVAQRVTQTLAHGELVTIPGAGHSVPGDNPEAFYAAVTPFLRQHAAGLG